MTDPFGTGRLRRTVLATWAAQPDRFREDANAEEDHARGGYRDRVVVELAQNAADAAARVGTPGRLLLRRVDVGADRLLVAANTGAPLDADGVASLASLRASAKRGSPGQVGRFGVGFAAVRSVADDVAVLTRAGDGVAAVHFSLARASDEVGALPALEAEVRRRGGDLPVLRLPFEGPGAVGALTPVLPGEWDTVVVLRLRDDDAVRAVAEQLDGVGDPLLVALPALATVTVTAAAGATPADPAGGERTVADVADRWLVVSRSGHVDAALLADRPVEERERTAWSVTWAVPHRGPVPSSAVVHAPTPTDDPCTVPALLVGTFPLDPSRRRVAPGPLTDVLVEAAGEVLADLALACRGEGPDPLGLVPVGLPAGPLDAALHEAVLRAVRTAPVLTPADGGPAVAPREAVVLSGPAGHDPALLGVLAPRLPDLVRADPRRRAVLRALGVEEVDPADVVDTLPALSPADHRRLLEAASAAGPQVQEALASVLVPLADGRTVRGARGLAVLDEQLPDDVVRVLAGWGLRVVHPDAAHPLHERLGAEPLSLPALLEHPVLRAYVLAADDGEAAPVLLALVERALAGGAHLGRPAWWGELLVPAADGEPSPARGLVLPGTPAQRWFDADVLPAVEDASARAWPAALAAVGVRTSLPVVVVPSEAYELEGGPDEPDDVALVVDRLDGWADYVAENGLTSRSAPQHVVEDLDAVRPEAWPEVLGVLAAEHPATLDAVRGPEPVPSYTAWTLRRLVPGLARPFSLEGGSALLPGAPDVVAGLPVHARRALGGAAGLDDLDARAWTAVLDGLEPGAALPLGEVVAAWRALARLAADPATAVDGDRVPALPADGPPVAAPADDVVVCSPTWAQRTDLGARVVVPWARVDAVAAMLDVDAAADRAPGRITSRGVPADVPAAVRAVLPDAPSSWVEHDDLRVDGRTVDWWVQDGVVHAATTSGLAHGLAEVVGWHRRHLVARLLTGDGVPQEELVGLAGEDDQG